MAAAVLFSEVKCCTSVGELRWIFITEQFLKFCLSAHSSRGSSQAGGGGDSEFHSHKGDVAVPDARQAERSDPRLPGPLRACGEWRVTGPAPHQGCHAGRCTGVTVSQLPFVFNRDFVTETAPNNRSRHWNVNQNVALHTHSWCCTTGNKAGGAIFWFLSIWLKHLLPLEKSPNQSFPLVLGLFLQTQHHQHPPSNILLCLWETQRLKPNADYRTFCLWEKRKKKKK